MRDNVAKVLERDEKLSELDQRAGQSSVSTYILPSVCLQQSIFIKNCYSLIFSLIYCDENRHLIMDSNYLQALFDFSSHPGFPVLINLHYQFGTLKVVLLFCSIEVLYLRQIQKPYLSYTSSPYMLTFFWRHCSNGCNFFLSLSLTLLEFALILWLWFNKYAKIICIVRDMRVETRLQVVSCEDNVDLLPMPSS